MAKMLSQGNTQEETVPESRLDLPGGWVSLGRGRAARSKMGLQIAPAAGRIHLQTVLLSL